MKTLIFPIEVAEEDKLNFAHRADELLRLEHNAMGVKFNNKEITKEEWELYQKEDFEIKSKAIHRAISEQKINAYNNTSLDVDLTRDIGSKEII